MKQQIDENINRMTENESESRDDIDELLNMIEIRARGEVLSGAVHVCVIDLIGVIDVVEIERQIGQIGHNENEMIGGEVLNRPRIARLGGQHRQACNAVTRSNTPNACFRLI